MNRGKVDGKNVYTIAPATLELIELNMSLSAIITFPLCCATGLTEWKEALPFKMIEHAKK